MKKDIRISPIGLKGNEINERMRQLMGIQSINENKSNIVIELTKMGPDGNAYAIVRENHEWYIKKANKSKGLIAEDFKYIGGLMNKKDEAYSSYSKAIKHLNLKFKSLAEAYNFEGEINVFENDNLLSEDVGGYSEMRGSGFSNEGNMEHNTPMFEADDVELSEAEMAVDKMLESEESDKEFAALAEPKDKITYADKIAGAQKNELNESPMETVNWALSILMAGGMFASVWAIFQGKKILEKLATRLETNPEVEIGKAADYILSFMGGLSNRIGENSSDDMENITSNEDAYSKAFASMGVDTDPSYGADKADYMRDSQRDEDALKSMGLKESRFSIDSAVKNMDRLIENLTEGLKKKV